MDTEHDYCLMVCSSDVHLPMHDAFAGVISVTVSKTRLLKMWMKFHNYLWAVSWQGTVD